MARKIRKDAHAAKVAIIKRLMETGEDVLCARFEVLQASEENDTLTDAERDELTIIATILEAMQDGHSSYEHTISGMDAVLRVLV